MMVFLVCALLSVPLWYIALVTDWPEQWGQRTGEWIVRRLR